MWPASAEATNEAAMTLLTPSTWPACPAWGPSGLDVLRSPLAPGSRPGPELKVIPIWQVEPEHHSLEAISACVPVSMETVTSLWTEPPQAAPNT